MIASDIDRTLLWSHKRVGGVPAERLVCLEVLDGRDWAYVTRAAWDALTGLADRHRDDVVLCTTRTPAQVQRLRLPGYRRVLCLNGGALLVDGVPDPDHARATAVLLGQRRPLAGFADRVAHLVAAPHVRSLRDADGAFAYFLLDPERREDVDPGWLEELETIAAEDGWRLTHEQTKVYAMPDTLTKESGLARLLAAGDDELVGAAGDSLLDEGMLRMARHALVPRGSYLESHGWDGAVTRDGGVLAGEEVACWLAGLLDRPDEADGADR